MLANRSGKTTSAHRFAVGFAKGMECYDSAVAARQ
jgi:hypothetical protein